MQGKSFIQHRRIHQYLSKYANGSSQFQNKCFDVLMSTYSCSRIWINGFDLL